MATQEPQSADWRRFIIIAVVQSVATTVVPRMADSLRTSADWMPNTFVVGVLVAWVLAVILIFATGTRKRFIIAASAVALVACCLHFFVSFSATPGPGGRVPTGFRPAAGTAPEPFAETGWAREIVHDKTGMEMVFIPAGEFMMGSDSGDSTQKPVHRVSISRPFYLGKYEVTQAQWRAVMGTDPSHFKGDRNPVEQVSWDDCQQFLQKLGGKNGATVCALPTEAEWEYACRAGTKTDFSFGDDEKDLVKYAWYGANCFGTSHAVGGQKPNPWGLYDMHGNVCEWCQDWLGSYYPADITRDPQGPTSGDCRTVRGGGWESPAAHCWSSARLWWKPLFISHNTGLRVRVGLAKGQ
jgi:formylglycine-generating enzyme required for sulfatase activity